MYTIDNCPHFGCKDCLYFKIDADLENVKSTCKRIDHKIIKFYTPWFKSYDCGQLFHIPCGDFIPKDLKRVDCINWTNFKDFWDVYVKSWLPYENENTLIPFVVNGHSDIVYHVPLKRFIDGTMIENGVLRAVEKTYYKRTKNDFGVQLYTIVHEKINGVKLEVQTNENN